MGKQIGVRNSPRRRRGRGRKIAVGEKAGIGRVNGAAPLG
jgi:hypothetical protein